MSSADSIGVNFGSSPISSGNCMNEKPRDSVLGDKHFCASGELIRRLSAIIAMSTPIV